MPSIYDKTFFSRILFLYLLYITAKRFTEPIAVSPYIRLRTNSSLYRWSYVTLIHTAKEKLEHCEISMENKIQKRLAWQERDKSMEF